MRAAILTLSLLALAACDTQDDPPQGGGQFGQETDDGARCVEVSRVGLADDEVSGLGFSPADLTGWAAASHSADVTWSDDSAATMSLTIEVTGAADFVDYDAEYGDGMTDEMGIECPSLVEIPITLSFSTDDGQLNESVSWTLAAESDEVFSLWVDLDEDVSLAGSFNPMDWATEDFDEVWADLLLTIWRDDGIEGEIAGYGEKTHGTGPDGAVSMTMFPIATITGAPATPAD